MRRIPSRPGGHDGPERQDEGGEDKGRRDPRAQRAEHENLLGSRAQRPAGGHHRTAPLRRANEFSALQSPSMRVGDLEILPVHDGWARLPATDLLRFTGGRDDPWLPHESS